MSTDRIEKSIVLRAPRARVWRALVHPAEFSAWFGVALEGVFAPGARLTGRHMAPGHEHETMDFAVERVEPEHLLTYRWHPVVHEPGVDGVPQPATLVEFHLVDVVEGTRLIVIESGFDGLPMARRAAALRVHDAGWVAQLGNLAGHVAA